MRTRFALVVGLLVCYCGIASAQVREEWVARYDGPSSLGDGARDIAVDKGGNVYVTGGICDVFSSNFGCTNGAWATVKYDAAGNQLWSASYYGPAAWADSPAAVAVDSAGNVYVTGSMCMYAVTDNVSLWCSGSEYTTIKYSTNGDLLWVARYSGPGYDAEANAIVLDAEGNVHVTGSSAGVDYSYDYVTIKYDTNGNQLWVARYNGPANDFDSAYAVALDAAGSVYVTGYSGGTASTETATIKYDARGNQIWVARSGEAAPSAIAVAAGSVYVTGLATTKYDGDGHELWVARYNGPGTFRANALAVDGSGNAYVTGWGAGTSPDYATIKYDPDGNERWVARYNGPGNGFDWATAIVLDASRNVYVTGLSDGTVSRSNYATIKYDNDGNELWVARYDGPGNGYDAAAAIVVDDVTSNVYITGYSWGGGTGFDYATIRYSQTPLKAAPTVTVTGGTFAYDGSPHQASATATGIDGLPVAGTFAFDYTPGGAAAPTAPGTYLVTVTFTSADPNYFNGASNGTLTIAPVVVPAPGPTSPVSPVGSIATSTPTFSWSAVGAARYYALSVTDANMAAPILMWYTPPLAGCGSGVGTCTVAAPRALLPGLVTWKVITWNPSGYGPWSSIATAIVDLADASVPSPALLVPSGPIATHTPTYTWTPVPGAIWYQLSVSVQDMLGVVVAFGEVWATPAQACMPSSCAVTPNLLLPAGRTQWKVKVWRTGGGGSWSVVATFNTADVAPGKATLVSPVTPVTTATPSFTWNAVLDTSYYLLRLTDRDNTSIDRWYRPGDAGCPFGTGLCAVSPGVSMKAGAASWKVLTWNASGYGPWSDTSDFVIEIR